jgi:hypothetical protein
MMLHVKFNKLTSSIALALFSAYFFYGLFRLPFVQYLVSLSVGGIAYGISDSYEVAVFSLLLMNFIFPYFAVVKGGRLEQVAQAAQASKEGFQNVNPTEVSNRIRQMKEGPIQGVASPMSEGFENAGETTEQLMEKTPPPAIATTGASTTAPAPALNASTPPPAVPVAPVVNTPALPDAAKAAQANAMANQPAQLPPVNKPAETFQDNGSLFKLGQIPTDSKGGYHIDAGTTVINALNSLKPDQIQAMTKDTRQLIETQKSLMSMLQTFSPMVNEGKQMMETFNQMFAPTAGALQNAQAVVGGR